MFTVQSINASIEQLWRCDESTDSNGYTIHYRTINVRQKGFFDSKWASDVNVRYDPERQSMFRLRQFSKSFICSIKVMQLLTLVRLYLLYLVSLGFFAFSTVREIREWWKILILIGPVEKSVILRSWALVTVCHSHLVCDRNIYCAGICSILI